MYHKDCGKNNNTLETDKFLKMYSPKHIEDIKFRVKNIIQIMKVHRCITHIYILRIIPLSRGVSGLYLLLFSISLKLSVWHGIETKHACRFGVRSVSW